MQEALDELRRELNGERIDFGELVRLGAREMALRLRAERDRSTEIRRRLAEEIRNGALAHTIDIEAAEHVRRRGWADREPSP